MSKRIREIVEKRKTVKASVGSFPYIEIGDIDTYTKDYSLKDKGSVPGAVLAYQGDILVSTVRPTRGAITTVKEESPAVSSAFAVLKPNERLCMPRYLFYCLCSKPFLQYLGANSKGATYPTCSKDDVLDYEFKVAGLNAQTEIIKKLDTVSGIITKRQQELATLDDLVKARFIEMFGDPDSNPKEWVVDTLGQYMTVLTDFSANGSYELLDSNVVMRDEPDYAIMVRTTDLESGNLETGVKYIDQHAYEILSKSKLFGGELIMNKIGSAGKIYVMPKIDRPASLGRNAFMFRFDDRINMTYLYALLTTEYGEREIQQYVRGAVTKTITKDATRSIRIIVPPIELQEQFASFVAQVDKSKVAVQKALDETQVLFDSLMQQYFG